MSVRKLSVALEDRVAEGAGRSAYRQDLSLSAWLTRGAENALAVEDGLAAVAEWMAERGALAPEETAADAAPNRFRRKAR
jgi:hypothetical protein